MDCAEARTLIDPYLDGELGLERSIELGRHLPECADCRRALETRRALGTALRRKLPYHEAPSSLRSAVFAGIGHAAPADARATPSSIPGGAARARRLRAATPSWLQMAASFLLVAALSSTLTYYAMPRGDEVARGTLIGDEVFASHVRGVMSESRLIDVASSDSHTVKPWFSDKIDFSPPVMDFAKEGFPLVGGRVDYIGGRRVAALVYRRNKHVITVFIWPTPPDERSKAASALAVSERRGETLVQWSDGTMTFWAVSDVNGAELVALCKLIRGADTGAEAPEPSATRRSSSSGRRRPLNTLNTYAGRR